MPNGVLPGAAAGAAVEPAFWTAVTASAANGFTGALVARQDALAGTLWFSRGWLVHAETGDLTGEAAFREIMLWPGASCSTESDAPAPQASIRRSLAVLLLELRGRRADPVPTPAPAPPPSLVGHDRADWLAAATRRIRAIPGVLRALLGQMDGTPAPELDPPAPGDLAALALAPAARRLGDALGLGRPVLGLARGAERVVLLVVVREQQLAIVLRADREAEAQTQVRAILHGPRTA